LNLSSECVFSFETLMVESEPVEGCTLVVELPLVVGAEDTPPAQGEAG
jgi:hypothetical protein